MGEAAIVAGLGTQSDFGFALVRMLLDEGYEVAALARRSEVLEQLQHSLGAPAELRAHRVDLTDADAIRAVVEEVERTQAPIGAYVHNAARLVRGSLVDVGVDAFRSAWQANVETALVPSHAILPRLAKRGRGTVIYTGATAAIRGSAGFGPFASAKFALRGLAQSAAREFGPRGVHVVHVVVDGVIWGRRAEADFGMTRSACIEPDALARTYLQLIRQPASCWTHEIDVRPSTEKF